jgi:UDP-glucose 4-epimerase
MSTASGDHGCVLVTGGGGYVGSHCTLELLNQGFKVVAVDNFVNSIKGECDVRNVGMMCLSVRPVEAG